MKRVPSLFWIIIFACLSAIAIAGLVIKTQAEKVLSEAAKITEAQDAEILGQVETRVASMKFVSRNNKLGLYMMIAGRYGQLGQQEKMYEIFEKALTLDPENAEIMNNLSYEWAKHGINLDKAKTYSQKAVEIVGKKAFDSKPSGMSRERWDRLQKSEHGNYLDTYGWVLYKKGNYSKALEVMKKAFGLADDPTIQYHLGMALYKTGDIDGAIENLIASLSGRVEDPVKAKSDLEMVYKEKYKTLKGLDKLLQQAVEKSLARQQAEDEADAAKVVGKSAPGFTLTDLNDQSFKLSDFRDKVVILDFWATWCGPCKLAMPLVNKVYLEYKDQGLVVLGINLEGRDKNELVKSFIEKSGYQFTILQGGMMGIGLDQVYDVTGIPTTFVIDKQGVIRYRHIGYREDLDKMLSREVEELLKQ